MTGLNKTKIQWVHPDPKHRYTANPIWGCDHGCPYCYAETVARRYNLGDFRRPRFYRDRIEAMALFLARQTKTAGVFLCSMSDPFNSLVEPAWLDQVIQTVRDLPQHQFYMVTKRPSLIRTRLTQAGQAGPPPDNLVLGVTVEDRSVEARISYLLNAWSGRTMVSYEPVLGPPPEIPPAIDWLVIGGLSPQTGWLPEGWSSMPGLHEASAIWARELINKARSSQIPVFLKTHPAELPGLSEIEQWPRGWTDRHVPGAQGHQPAML